MARKGKKSGPKPLIAGLVLKKLEEAFAIGCSDEEACAYADISEATLYNYQGKHPKFVERKKQLKKRPILKAKNTVVQALDQVPVAERYLARYDKEQQKPDGPQLGVPQTEKEVELMTQLLNKHHDYINANGSEPEETS